MKQIIKILVTMLSYVVIVANVFAADSDFNHLVEGQSFSASRCMSCHGQDLLRSYPKLAGQNTRYFIRQMLAFKNGQRENTLMQAMVVKLSMPEIKELALYFSKQAISSGLADQKSLIRGQMLYRYGDKTQRLPACMACHGPAGEGNSLAGIPMLAGQYADYTQIQLLAYKAKKRQTDSGGIMRDIAGRLAQEDILALANYISGLHRPH